jgi:hypothetical protein
MKFLGRQKFAGGKRAVMIVAAIIGATARITLAQSCAMCYQNAAASGTRGKVALQHGILILALPAIAIFGTILSLLYTRQNPNRDLPQASKSHQNILRDKNGQLPELNA